MEVSYLQLLLIYFLKEVNISIHSVDLNKSQPITNNNKSHRRLFNVSDITFTTDTIRIPYETDSIFSEQ